MRPARSVVAPLSLALAVALAGCATPAPSASSTPAPVAQPAQSSLPSRQYSIADFVETTGVSGAGFSHDGSRLLLSSNKTGIWNVYSMPASGGEWTPITRSTTDNVYAVGYFPHDDRLLVTRDAGGNELNHLYVIGPDGRERDLTPGDKLKAGFGGFSGDGKAFYVTSNERDPKFMDVYRYDAGSYARTLLYRNTDGMFPGAISRDGRWLAVSRPNTSLDSDLFVVDLRTGKRTEVSTPGQVAAFAGEDFSPDGQWLYYTANDAGEFAELRRYHLASGRHEPVRRESWDVSGSSFSEGGRYRVDTINRDASTAMEITDTRTGQVVPLPRLPNGEVRGAMFTRDDSTLAFHLNGDRQPTDLFVMPIGGQATQLTRALNPAIDPRDLVDSSIVRFASFDGLQIPNVLWKPHQATASNKVPALVWVHGGPGGQTTRNYSAVQQYLANHGYVVLGINNRGSSGYGKTFFAADDGKHGREPLWDTLAAKKYLQSLPYVDPDRIGIIGGSYGGYMTAAAMAFHPKEFKVGVNIFGVTNWLRTLESIPPWWEAQRELLYKEIGNPKTQRDFLIATSPLFHADKIERPFMVLQGANDPRVLQAESDEIVAAVRKNGVPVEYVLFPDEGHGFSKKKNQIEGYGRVLQFLDTYLKGDGPK